MNITPEIIQNALIVVISQSGVYTSTAEVHLYPGGHHRAFKGGKEIDHRIDWQYCGPAEEVSR